MQNYWNNDPGVVNDLIAQNVAMIENMEFNNDT
jgi:hypothetical protein